jgi:hypothetical protein
LSEASGHYHLNRCLITSRCPGTPHGQRARSSSARRCSETEARRHLAVCRAWAGAGVGLGLSRLPADPGLARLRRLPGVREMLGHGGPSRLRPTHAIFERYAEFHSPKPRPLPKLIGNMSRIAWGEMRSSAPRCLADAARSGGVPELILRSNQTWCRSITLRAFATPLS